MKPFLLGLTGNIACGKTTVGRILVASYGVQYLDCDLVVHALYEPGTQETAAIARQFGQDLLQADGTIDRRRLGDKVMAEPARRQQLEALLQPSIRRDVDAVVAASTARVLVLDAIRLIEAGLGAECDTLWVVTCRRDDQIRRLAESRHFSPAQAALRVDAQAPQEEKARLANAVIANVGPPELLEKQVKAAWEATVSPRLSA